MATAPEEGSKYSKCHITNGQALLMSCHAQPSLLDSHGNHFKKQGREELIKYNYVIDTYDN
jgi:hypothetical protein